MTDVAGILARYGIAVECEKDREYLLDLVRRLSEPWLRPGFKPPVMDEAASVLMSLLVCPKEGAWARNQAHVQEQSSQANEMLRHLSPVGKLTSEISYEEMLAFEMVGYRMPNMPGSQMCIHGDEAGKCDECWKLIQSHKEQSSQASTVTCKDTASSNREDFTPGAI
jgi:hypothetical protein